MKFYIALAIIVLMNTSVVCAQTQQDAAPDNAPLNIQPTAEEPAKPAAPITPEEAIQKLGLNLSENADVIEQIKRDAAQRAAKPAPAAVQQPTDDTNAPGTAFDRTQRFTHPLNRVVEYRNAQNVVINDVSFNDLPEAIRMELQDVLGSCQESSRDMADLKNYSYVSDLQRAHGLSPNYFIDFSKLTSKKSGSCAPAPPCTEEGCLFITFNTIGFKHWNKDVTLRVKDWTVRQIDDQSASPIPQINKPTIISVFDIDISCKDGNDEDCHTQRIWLSGGLSAYTPPKQ